MAGLFRKKPIENIDNNMEEKVKALLLDDNPEGIIAASENGNIIYSNKLGREMMELGLFGPIDIVSKNTKEFVYKDRTYEARYTKLPDSSGIKGTIAYLVDTIGETKQANEIAELKVKLEKANNFKAAFLANMSHEIRTPIHAIIGFAEIMMKQNVSEDVKNQIDMIKNSSYSLLAIINDVLDLSKLEAGKMELVNSNYYISYIIRDIEATFSLLAYRKNIKFEMHIDDDIPCYIYGDKIRIRGTLSNILNNAIKFTKEGRVDFYIHALEKKNGQVTLQFEIKDTGVGIKKEDQERIFESFSKFDINNNYSIEGRGLGLSIAKGYMDLMDGSIAVKSEYGVGSTFTVTVKQKIVDDSPVDMNIVNARKKATEKFIINDYKALVVDDNAVNLTVAEGLMSTYKLKVDKAGGGREAIDKCMANKYDIIFMDQMMPEVDGIMAMQEIRKINDFYANECKIIVLTADAMVGVRDRLLNEGFNEYLSKPLEIHRLEAILRQFVPSEYISMDEKPDVVVESKNADAGRLNVRPDDEISVIAENLGIDKSVLERKIKDCGGSISDFKGICEIAINNYEDRINKLRESQAIKDYDRYTIAVHSLKSSIASLGGLEISEEAKKQETAGKEGDYAFIDERMEGLITKYYEYMQKIKQHVLGIHDEPKKEVTEGEEWTKEEIAKVFKRITSLVEEYNFGAIFELLTDVLSMDMGPNTRELFNNLEKVMNDMDIDGLKKILGEYI